MKRTPGNTARWLLLLTFCAASTWAQEAEQATPAEGQPPVDQVEQAPAHEGVTDLEAAALQLVEEILQEQQVIISGQNFVYQAGGRRDPFRNLLQSRQRQLDAPAQRPAGLPGFMVSEVQVAAVAQYQGRWHAMLIGMDKRMYFAQVGTQLYDGRVVQINDRDVIFEQEVQDMMGARSTRQVAKRLNTGTREQQP